MGLGSILEFRDHFATYVNELSKVIGRAGRESRCGLIALDYWHRKAGAAWSLWQQ